MHLLELLRTDARGRVTERVVRWINRPGIEAEVFAAGACDARKSECDFVLTWAHPQKLDPKKLLLQLDGVKQWQGVTRRAQFTIAKGSKPQIVSCDVEFPDGTRATYSRTLYAFNPEEAQASLVAVPVVPAGEAWSNDDLATRLKEAGLPVRVVEETEPEVTFVMDAHALDKMVETSVTGSGRRQRRWPASGSAAFESVHVVFPDESLPADTLRLERLGSIVPKGRGGSHFSRWADAVAAAGYGLGASPKRRAVVLVLSGFDRPNGSSFTAAQAQAYLAEIMVPLFVWRIGSVDAPEWPSGPILENRSDVAAALDALRSAIERQRILWLEGFRDTRYLGRWLFPGVALAGRDAPATSGSSAAAMPSTADATAAAVGPDGGPVHALAASAGGSVVYAGTHGGVFRSVDRGERWEAASAGLPIAPVRCLVVDGDTPDHVYAGTDAGLFASADAGRHWRRVGGELGSAPVSAMALDPASPRVLLVGTAGGGVLRSDDAGETLLATALASGEVRALAVAPKDLAILAATETGVFRSADRGLSWTETGRLPARALAVGLASGGALFAATAGRGLWRSEDGGASWRAAGLPGAYLTSLGLDTPSRAMLAGAPDGVFVSSNGGGAWKLASIGSVEAIAAAAGASLAGSAHGVVRRLDSGGWKDSSAGLAASIVHAVAVGPESTLYAATSSGLRRRSGSVSGWKPVPGIPEGIVADAVVPIDPGRLDLCIGTTGSIGRSENAGVTWSFTPTEAAFHLAFDAAKPDVLLAAGREGVLKSVDGGRHWAVSASGMEKTFVLQLAHDAAEPDAYYAATAGGGVFRTADAARSWKPVGAELTRRVVRSVSTDPGDGRVVFAGTDSGIFRSVDRGENWAPESEGLPRAPVYALLADPGSAGSIFAGTAEGLFRTTDGGASWAPFPAQGLRVPVTSLSLDREANALVAGSFGAGVFVVPLAASPPR